MQFKRKISAFTLIELLVTIAIMGMLSTISVATYNNYISGAKVATVKKTVNDLYRYTVLYAREKDVLYSEIVMADLLTRFKISESKYGQVAYVADDYDFFYISTMPASTASWWSVVEVIPRTYAQTKTNNEYYAAGTPGGMKYYETSPATVREALIISGVSAELNNEAIKGNFGIKTGFNIKKIELRF